MQAAHHQPRVMIVDDDPVSLRFLEAAVAQCACSVVAAANGTQAMAAEGRFELLLIDRHLPDMDGAALLRALRDCGVGAIAIATSAEIDAALAAQLCGAGFVDVLEKPASVQGIHEALSRHLPRRAAFLDDGAALDSSGGDANVLRALRGLLARELEELERDLTRGNLASSPPQLDQRLHRLRASCGFCGASALAAHAADLQVALRVGNRFTHERRNAFIAVCRETAAVLRN